MRDMRFSLGIWALTPCADRFATAGYRAALTPEEQIELASKVEGLAGLILQYPNVVNESNIHQTRSAVKDAGLVVAAVDANLFGPQFALGSFTAPDARTRQEAQRIAAGTVDTARELGSRNVGLWLGQDGFDYPFQVDYKEMWERLVEGVRATAERDPAINVCIEYKVKEPRNYIVPGHCAKALLLCQDVGLPNVGVTLDFGHALMSRESPAEAAAAAASRGRLFSVHWNDAYGVDDDDLIAGCLHLWQGLELVLWLDRLGYDGWHGLDIFPYREDPVRAASLSIKNVRRLQSLAARLDERRLRDVWASMSATEAVEYLYTAVFGQG